MNPRLTNHQADDLAAQKQKAEQEEKKPKRKPWYVRMKSRLRKYGDYE